MVLINTVFDSREEFSQRQYDSTNQAHHELAVVGYPSEKDFKNMVHSGMIPNFPVTLDDIKSSNTIFVPDVPSLKGKIMRRQTRPVVSNEINILKDILQLHKTLSVAADIVFVNRMAFLVSISIHVKFTTVQYLVKRMAGNIIDGNYRVITVISSR